MLRAVVVVGVAVAVFFYRAYGVMMSRNALNVDKYTRSRASFKDRVSVAFTHWCVCRIYPQYIVYSIGVGLPCSCGIYLAVV